jgi:hypothetical protein
MANISPLTISKYTNALKDLVSKADGKTQLSSIELAKEHKVDTNFVTRCVKLGYVKRTTTHRGRRGPGIYMSNLSSEEIEPHHARKIALLGVSAKKIKEKQEEKLDTSLSRYSDMELLSELKERGYSGEINKVIKVSI